LLIDVVGQPCKMTNSNWVIAQAALRAMKSLAEILGFCPTARARLSVPAQQAFEPTEEPQLDEHGNPMPTLDEYLAEGDRIYAKAAADDAAARRAKNGGAGRR
jgi:hypothetical protein